MSDSSKSVTGRLPVMTWADFLASCPPDVAVNISDLTNASDYKIATPDLYMYCESEGCKGFRFFGHYSGEPLLEAQKWKQGFIYYRCRNCARAMKIFAVSMNAGSGREGVAVKLGESPPFGPHTPPRLISLIGPDRELFLQGRRAENRGMGIGAFAYYRRVVENQKGRIIVQISKVAEKLNANPEILKKFALAAKETQFSKAVDEIKGGIPEALLTDGHNPLTLLHTALSEGLHDHSDAECLEIAQEIRLVLTDLAERISQALKEEDELKAAVSRLLSRKLHK